MHALRHERRYLIPFRATLLPQIFTDVLVIGSGVAGLRAALEAANGDSDVILLSKDKLELSNTSWAQGGIAGVFDADDSFDAHVTNTLDAGAGLCDEPVVRQIVNEAPQRIEELVQFGMALDRTSNGDYMLGREGGHTAHRIVHAHGDATGKELSRALIGTANEHDRIRLFDHCFALDLITEGEAGTRCLGAITHHPKHGLQMIWAKATIIASGGCGKIYRETTNAPVATGDGLAMAWRAGASLADVEFMQFHPTTLYVAGASRTLITEAVRGEGAYLVDRAGNRFMEGEHELAELAPRDIVARAILRHLESSHATNVFLDARHIEDERFAQRFPSITRQLQQFQIDPAKDLIPIRPSAHYLIGGLWVDEGCRTNVPGLYACGEAACTGLHGANRLASNSLLEGLVCGAAAGATCREMFDEPATMPIKVVSDVPLSDRSELDIADVRSSLRSVMWRHVGIQRDGDRLPEVAEMFDFWARYTQDKIFDEKPGWEVQNQLTIGALMTRAAHWRAESRGTHYRVDKIGSDDRLRAHAKWTTGGEEPELVPVRDGT